MECLDTLRYANTERGKVKTSIGNFGEVRQKTNIGSEKNKCLHSKVILGSDLA